MPCDQIQLMRVEFLAENLSFLKAALEAAGLTIVMDLAGYLQWRDRNGNYGRWQDGQFVVQPGFDTDAIKRLYANEVIKTVAKKRNWQQQKKTEKTGKLVRRY